MLGKQEGHCHLGWGPRPPGTGVSGRGLGGLWAKGWEQRQSSGSRSSGPPSQPRNLLQQVSTSTPSEAAVRPRNRHIVPHALLPSLTRQQSPVSPVQSVAWLT